MNTQYIATLLIIYFAMGLSVGVFVKHSLRILLFFIGFYTLVTLALVYGKIITINISVEKIATMMHGDGNVVEKIKMFFGVERIVELVGFILGLCLGLKKG